MGPFRLGQGLEPVGDLVEALVPRRLRHPRIHVGVLVGLTGDGGFQIVAGGADRQSGRRVADALHVLQVAVGMARLALRRGAEYGRDVVLAFDVRLGGEVQIPSIRLRFPGERVLQVLQRLAVRQIHVFAPFPLWPVVVVR